MAPTKRPVAGYVARILPCGKTEVKPSASFRQWLSGGLITAPIRSYIAGMTTYLTTPQGRHIAYHQTQGRGPGVVFLGGFKSDMTGSKALHLQAWAEETGRAFLRFDYSGHGASHGKFEDGAISDWLQDAEAVIQALTEGPQVLVGSSMGGWIALLLARSIPEKIAGLLTIAAAPDFTRRIRDVELSAADRLRLTSAGRVERPSDYSDTPYIITRRLIEDGEQNLVLDRPLALPMPVRFLQGTADTDVPPSVAVELFDHVTGPDIRLTLVKGADHRFSTPDCLNLITTLVTDLL